MPRPSTSCRLISPGSDFTRLPRAARHARCRSWSTTGTRAGRCSPSSTGISARRPTAARAAVTCCHGSRASCASVPVIVYSQNIDAFNVRSQIQRSHPRALLHDKRDGDASLLERVDRMLDRTVGDLRIHDGTVVVHLPSLDQHHHREAIRLVVHYPDIVTFHSDTATKAVRGSASGSPRTTPRCGWSVTATASTGSPPPSPAPRLARHEPMNLGLAEIPELPLAAALVDGAGEIVARTPEWDGPGPAPSHTRCATPASWSARCPRLPIAMRCSAGCWTRSTSRRRPAWHPGAAGADAVGITPPGGGPRRSRSRHDRRGPRPGACRYHRQDRAERRGGPRVEWHSSGARGGRARARPAGGERGAPRRGRGGSPRGRPDDLPGHLAARRLTAGREHLAPARGTRALGPGVRTHRGGCGGRHGVPASRRTARDGRSDIRARSAPAGASRRGRQGWTGSSRHAIVGRGDRAAARVDGGPRLPAGGAAHRRRRPAGEHRARHRLERTGRLERHLGGRASRRRHDTRPRRRRRAHPRAGALGAHRRTAPIEDRRPRPVARHDARRSDAQGAHHARGCAG